MREGEHERAWAGFESTLCLPQPDRLLQKVAVSPKGEEEEERALPELLRGQCVEYEGRRQLRSQLNLQTSPETDPNPQNRPLMSLLHLDPARLLSSDPKQLTSSL